MDTPRGPPADARQTLGKPRVDARQPGVSTRGRRKGKLRLLSRANIDNRCKRTLARFDAIAHGIAQDLGGEQHLTTVQKHLVEAFAGAALSLGDLNARLLLGEEIDLLQQSQAVNALVKLASRLGTSRVASEVAPDLQTYLRAKSLEAAE